MEKPPDINPELVQEVESRMRSQASPTAQGSNPAPKNSPNKHASLRARRTGLSTVMEVKGPDSLNPIDRISPILRRASGNFQDFEKTSYLQNNHLDFANTNFVKNHVF